MVLEVCSILVGLLVFAVLSPSLTDMFPVIHPAINLIQLISSARRKHSRSGVQKNGGYRVNVEGIRVRMPWQHAGILLR